MVLANKFVTGYYRYTDVWFDWPKACGEDGEILKAALAHDALVASDHPIHVEGVDGAQLYLGTLKTGETRLLFSSNQIEYIRYWLHAVGMTKEPLPLPYSNCLLREQDLRGVAPQTFKTGGDLKFALKKIEKINKNLSKSNNPPLTFRRTCFENSRSLWQGKVGAWCAIDFESWEMDHTMITEIGWSMVHWEAGEQVSAEGHFIVDEYQSYTNGKYVPENRKNYQWGKSEIVKKKDLKSRVQNLVNKLRSNSHAFLVFHDSNQDIKDLKTLGADLSGLSYTIPGGSSPDSGIFVVDTAELFGALLGEGNRIRSLGQICNQLGIPTQCLHNAGNDAHYTLAAFMSMASGNSIDLQRQDRWPSQTQGGVITVDLDSLEKSAASDEEEDIMSAIV